MLRLMLTQVRGSAHLHPVIQQIPITEIRDTMKETGLWKSEGISSEFGALRPQMAVKPRSQTNSKQ